MRFRRAIVEGAYPFIPWNLQAAIITFKKPMMHLVMKGAQCKTLFTIDKKAFVTGVRGRGGQRKPTANKPLYYGLNVEGLPEQW